MKWKKKIPIFKYHENSHILEKLAKINGIDDLEEFLHPTNESLHDSYMLNSIDVARDMIVSSINKNKKISIFSDVDCDGCCSTAIMYNYLKHFTNNVRYFHAQRDDGHGIKVSVNDIPEGTELLIIVDSSTSDSEACRIIQERGIDIIILDHHPSEEDNQYALIVNPQLDEYPNKDISGSGVCWKMCQVLDKYFNTKVSETLVDLAGIGIHADTMCMMNKENRYIVSQALKEVNNLGVQAILQLKGKNLDDLCSNDIAFTIAPMMNGASRMGRIELVLELLTCDDADRCSQLAEEIRDLNEERKKIQARFVNQFSEMVNEDDNIIVIIDHEHEVSKSFSGLIAGDLANKFQKPAMVLSNDREQNPRYRGSFRSYEDFPLKSFLRDLPEVVFTAGHEGAGGVGIPINDINTFVCNANNGLSGITFEPTLQYDLELSVKDITEQLIEDVQKFVRINGKNIKEVKFMINDLFVVEKKVLGKTKQDTIKIMCDEIDLIKFGVSQEYIDDFPVFSNIKAIGTLNINRWFNKFKKQEIVTKQLFLEEYVIK